MRLQAQQLQKRCQEYTRSLRSYKRKVHKMKKISAIAVLCLSLFAASNAASAQEQTPVLTQFATLDSLVAGVYDGFIPISELKSEGDFGIGTFHKIDGESILFEGNFYQVRFDGSVVRPKDDDTTPFASVVNFKPTKTFKIDSPKDYAAFKEALDELEPVSNKILAVHVHGCFTNVRTRSSYPQKKPYPPLTVALAEQPEFDLDDSEGDLIGFRLPPYVKGLNMPGYHFHFLNQAKTQGGHVLAFQLESGIVEIQEIDRFTVVLPPKDSAFYKTDLETDRSKEVQQVEGTK